MKRIFTAAFLVAFASCRLSETDISYDANDDKYEVITHVWRNDDIVGSKYNWRVGSYDSRVTLSQLDSTVKAHRNFIETIQRNMDLADSAISSH